MLEDWLYCRHTNSFEDLSYTPTEGHSNQWVCDDCGHSFEKSVGKKEITIPHVPEDACLCRACVPREEAVYPAIADEHGAFEGFTVKDSGKREQFSSGMVRDTQEGKVDYTRVLDGPMFYRWADHVSKAEKKYPDVAPGVPNWTLASGEAELIRFKKSAFRHFVQWLRGDTDEDHAAATLFNINGYEYVKEKLK